MENRRTHSRIKFETQCYLKGNSGDTYEVLLDDISMSGASVKVNAKTHLHIGDLCDLMLSDNTAVLPLKRSGTIVRYDSEMIAVNFLT